MIELKERISLVPVVLVGALLYMILNWIPVIGPLFMGRRVGRMVKGHPMKGAGIGILSAVVGFFCLNVFIFPNWDIFGRILLIGWNFIGIIFAGIGGAIGSMTSAISDLKISGDRRNAYTNAFHTFKSESDVKTLIICPNCSFTNPEGRAYCGSCGAKLYTD